MPISDSALRVVIEVSFRRAGDADVTVLALEALDPGIEVPLGEKTPDATVAILLKNPFDPTGCVIALSDSVETGVRCRGVTKSDIA
jgi:hypothetical protein